MRIAIDIRSLMEGRHSGVEEYATEIIKGLLRVGPEHSYILFYNSWKPVNLPHFDGDVEVRGFRFPNKIFNITQWLFSYPLWDSLVDADVFFVPNSRLTPLSRSVPLVSVAHDISFELFPEFLTFRRKIWHAIMRPRRLFLSSDVVIAVSEHTAEDLSRVYSLAPSHVRVVHSGVSLIDSSAMNVGDIYNLPDKFFFYLGTIEPRKNLPSLIKAYSEIASLVPHDLVIAGESGWRESELLEAIDFSGIEDRVHVLGFVPEDHKHALMKMADLFVYPSFYEGFGFPPIEALLSGTPVITSFNSSLPEVVGDYAVLIDPYNVSELALVLREMLLNLPKVPFEVRSALAQTYSWDRAAKETLAIIEDVALV